MKTAAQLESTLTDSLRGTRLIVVANREPYIHVRRRRTALGFHVQYHCNNFLDTVDRALPCQMEPVR